MINSMGAHEFNGRHVAIERAEKRIKELEELVLLQAKRIVELEIKLKEKNDAVEL